MRNPTITQTSEQEFVLENLKADGVAYAWLTVDKFSIRIKREHEGIVLDVYELDREDETPILASLHAFDSDLAGEEA